LDALGRLVTNDLSDLLGVLLTNALLERGLNAVLLAGGKRFSGLEAAQRDATLDELRLEHIEHGLDALFAVRLEQQLLAAELDARADVLEVEALRDLFLGLVDGVVELHLVDLAHDVER